MARFGKVKKAFALLGAVALMATMTGCTPTMIERADALSDNITTVCNVELDEMGSDLVIKNFELIGADVNKSSFDFDISFNGVASFTDNSVGFTSLNYEVPSTYFETLNKNTSYDTLYDIFDQVVSKYEPVNIEVSPVSSLSGINNAFIKNEVSPFEKYNITDGLLYNLGTPTFDDTECRVSFDTRTLVELKSTKVQAGFGLGIGFGGHVGIGMGAFVTPKQGTFTLQDNYSFTVDKETYEAMKNDISLVYDYCAQAINSKDSSKIQAKRISTTSVTYNNADLLNKVNINGLENEVTK